VTSTSSLVSRQPHRSHLPKIQRCSIKECRFQTESKIKQNWKKKIWQC